MPASLNQSEAGDPYRFTVGILRFKGFCPFELDGSPQQPKPGGTTGNPSLVPECMQLAYARDEHFCLPTTEGLAPLGACGSET